MSDDLSFDLDSEGEIAERSPDNIDIEQLLEQQADEICRMWKPEPSGFDTKEYALNDTYQVCEADAGSILRK